MTLIGIPLTTTRLAAAAGLLSLATAAFADQAAKLSPLPGTVAAPLVGVWTGIRPTNGYVWEFRFTLELKADGTYSYSVLQAGSRRRPWKLSMTGRWGVTRATSPTWPLQLEMVPDPGSPAPPTEEDRLALFDDLGLPDDRRHTFRVRPSSIGGFAVQPVEANPN